MAAQMDGPARSHAPSPQSSRPELPDRPNSSSSQSHARQTSHPVYPRPRYQTLGSPPQITSTPNSPPTRLHRMLSGSGPQSFPTFADLEVNNDVPIPSPNPRELLKHAAGVVKSRNGAVLSRGFILKSDFRPPAVLEGQGELDRSGGVHLRGAPNFRAAELDVYGCAQPTETGIRTVLSVLRSQPVQLGGGKRALGRETVWSCLREEPVLYVGEQPFVLRDAAEPTKTYTLSDRAENLEEIETRLKTDVIKEAQRYGGVILVQEEFGDREIRNTWVAADNVRTIREVFDEIRASGYNVSYHRVPVSRDQQPEDRYLDRYVTILASIPTSSTSLVFNCGVGVVRTTFAMSAALIVRRRQLMVQGEPDPFGEFEQQKPTNQSLAVVLRAKSEQATRDQSLLRLMNVLQKSIASKNQYTILTVMSSKPQLLESLRVALLGNYDLVLSLLSTFEDGASMKKLVDCIVDHCDDLVNLREAVLEHRVRYATSALLDEEAARDHRAKALAALERYFFLVSFAAYSQEAAPDFTQKFSSWLKDRTEIGKMISRLRKSGHFYIFSPVHDLSAIARGSDRAVSVSSNSKERSDVVERTGGEVIGDEWAGQIVRDRGGIVLRSGLILKNDQWGAAKEDHVSSVRGASNFRRVPATSTYALSQPTQDGIDQVLDSVRETLKPDARIAWLNLREEPLLYVNGTPYVLRLEAVSLRNVKSYAGISSSRLELLEERLKSDVLAEIKAFGGRLLLHSETEDGAVVPSWETVEDPSNIKTLREVMDAAGARSALSGGFEYRRVPITPTKSPDFDDVKDLVEVVAQLDLDRSAVLVNCQLGRGRSTRALVLVTLVQRWLRTGGFRNSVRQETKKSTRYSYTVIQNLLRVLRWGQEVKNIVDEAITQCSDPFDLLEAIEAARDAAEEAKVAGNETRQKEMTERGILNLRAYFFLILFTSFLMESKAETWRELRETSSYETWVRDRPVFRTIERELYDADLSALVPLERPAEDNQSDVRDFVAKRSGLILSAYTLLKSDFFSGLQKMSLPERVEGSPNFRRARLLFANESQPPLSADDPTSPLVFGSGMPTVEGLRRALERMGAKHRPIVWTNMREEPVIYVRGGRPHVLRLFEMPLENVVTTGVTTQVVEGMERSLKADLLKEAAANEGKVLLHDETEEAGTFTVTSDWEEIKPDDIQTPAEVFALMKSEGFLIDYARLPVTDEQAPIPVIFGRIESRVTKALTDHPGDLGLVFSCQMGRGRTTTGMVAAALVTNILHHSGSIFDVSASTIETGDESHMSWDGHEADPLLQGEYKLILQLIGVMQYGKLAKKLTDRAIDEMQGVQNLRKAVYDFKLRVDASESQSKKHEKLLEQALNYLYRYATLVIFANYLLEKAAAIYEAEDAASDGDHPNTIPLPPFTVWLEERRELKYLLKRKSLD